jgi:hypothetical protein
VSINELTLILKIISKVWRQKRCDVTDKNNNVSFEGHDIHYHKYNDESDSDVVCLNLQNYHYSIIFIV